MQTKEIKMLTFKNNTPFRLCIPKINFTMVHNGEDLDVIMPMCNLVRSLWNYYIDEMIEDANENSEFVNYWINETR